MTVSSVTSYGPFGEPSSQTDPSFTGQTQDTEPGLYDFPARRLSPPQGRWVSPDPAGIAASDPGTPQSWNRYAYVQNSPLELTDPQGLDCVYEDEDGSATVTYGDCGSDTDSGYYIDCDGCAYFASGATLDQATGDLYFTGSDGEPIDGTLIQGFADPVGTSTTIVVTPDGSGGSSPGSTWVQSTSNGTGGAAAAVPYSTSLYLPFAEGIGGYTYTFTHLAGNNQTTYNCSSHSATISTPAAKAALSGGPLTLLGQGTQNANKVISGWGWNFSLQVTPSLGYQVNINNSGIVGGFTFGVPGASASYGWGSCNVGG